MLIKQLNAEAEARRHQRHLEKLAAEKQQRAAAKAEGKAVDSDGDDWGKGTKRPVVDERPPKREDREKKPEDNSF